MFLNMNQMQPSICNISPMAPASDGLSVIFPVGQAPSTVKNEGLWWSAHGLLARDATEPQRVELHLCKLREYHIVVQFSTIVHMSGVWQWVDTNLQHAT